MYSPFDFDVDPNEPLDYAIDQLKTYGSVAPLMTLYRSSEKVFSIKFPAVDNPQQRLHTLNQAAWVSSTFTVTSMRFVVDSSVMVTTPTNEKKMMDALVVVYANSSGCHGSAHPYFMHPESAEPIWQTDNTITSDDVLDSQHALVGFSAAQFFFSQNQFPWTSYRKYLLSNGFEFIYHGQYNEDNIGSTMKTLV